MKKIIKKIDKFLLKILLSHYYNKCKQKSRDILSRGIDEYSEYTTEFIYETLVDSVHKTKIIKFFYIPVFPRFNAPKVFFEIVIDPMITKFPVIKSKFEKLGRNEKIIVKVKDTGARIQIKKKQFNQQKHIFIKTA